MNVSIQKIYLKFQIILNKSHMYILPFDTFAQRKSKENTIVCGLHEKEKNLTLYFHNNYLGHYTIS
jgi:hypothetical protein